MVETDPDPLNFLLYKFPSIFTYPSFILVGPTDNSGTHHFEGWKWKESMDILSFRTCETTRDPISMGIKVNLSHLIGITTITKAIA